MSALFNVIADWDFCPDFSVMMLQILCVLPFKIYKFVIFLKYWKQCDSTEEKILYNVFWSRPSFL